MEHLQIRANNAAFHVVRTGQGRPLLLLHGWPEFWLSWEPVMTRLASHFTIFAPDLRGFGDSDKPDGPFGPDQQAADIAALMDALGLEQAGIVGHDVGGAERFATAIEVDVLRTHVAQELLIPGTGYVNPSLWEPLIMKFCDFFGGGRQVHPSRLATAWEMPDPTRWS